MLFGLKGVTVLCCFQRSENHIKFDGDPCKSIQIQSVNISRGCLKKLLTVQMLRCPTVNVQRKFTRKHLHKQAVLDYLFFSSQGMVED